MAEYIDGHPHRYEKYGVWCNGELVDFWDRTITSKVLDSRLNSQLHILTNQ